MIDKTLHEASFKKINKKNTFRSIVYFKIHKTSIENKNGI